MCLLQKFVHSTIACSVSRTVWLYATLCASRRLRSPTPPPTDAITCQYAFVCRLHTVCVRSIYRLYAVSMLMGHLLGRYCSLRCWGVAVGNVDCAARRSALLGCRNGLAGWCSLAKPIALPYCLSYCIAYCIAYISYTMRVAHLHNVTI